MNLRRALSTSALAATLASGPVAVFAADPAAAPAPAPAAAPTPKTPEQRALDATHDKRMAWWREARFGMFIHWGIYAIPAGKWKGQEVTRSGAEWIENRGKIPVADYKTLPAQFNPTKFDATAWVELAKQTGMKYIVITSKHHDGFAMFHSKADPFNINDATPFKRDPLKELAAAAKKAGIKLGFYYSQAQDWNHPGGAAAGGHWDPKAQDGSMDAYIDKVAVPQVKELLSNYGPVSVLWWDTPVDMTPERGAKFLPLMKLQPDIVQNNRLFKTKDAGDFETPEQKIPPNGIAGKDWETCMTINGTWGFRESDEKWKTPETLIRNLVDIASKGGNFLLNVGPTKEGVIPAPSVERLKVMGAWMKVNGDAIYGTTASPLKDQLPWGRMTKKVGAKGTTLYLHVFDWPKDGKLVIPGLKGTIASGKVLATGKKVDVAVNASGTTVTVSGAAPDPISSTIVLEATGPLRAP